MAATDSNRSDLNRSLVRYLVDARNKAKLSQRQLAARLGKSQSYVGKYEAMSRRLDIAEYVEAAEELGLVVVVKGPGRPP